MASSDKMKHLLKYVSAVSGHFVIYSIFLSSPAVSLTFAPSVIQQRYEWEEKGWSVHHFRNHQGQLTLRRFDIIKEATKFLQTISPNCSCSMLLAKLDEIANHWGDFLRSVPCVTVWHQKIRFYTVSAREKSLKTYIVYVPMITKNCRGHLPGLSYLETEVVYVTQWLFWKTW